MTGRDSNRFTAALVLGAIMGAVLVLLFRGSATTGGTGPRRAGSAARD